MRKGETSYLTISNFVAPRKWALSCALQLLAGLVFLFVIFVLIVQSTTVIGMLLNFAGKEFHVGIIFSASAFFGNLSMFLLKHWDSLRRLMM
jgi:uncharacterized integral membrane protein